MDAFHRLLNSVEITAVQFLWAVVPAAGLMVLWKLGKLIARHAVQPVDAAPVGR